MAGTGTKQQTRTKTDITYPKRYNVMIDNDDFTPVGFVIQLLVEIFNQPIDSAQAITMAIHTEGRGLAGTYSAEIAEQKLSEAISLISRHNHPLNVYVEAV